MEIVRGDGFKEEFTSYVIDYTRVKSIEDVVNILKGLNIHVFNPEQSEHLSFLLDNGYLIPAPDTKQDDTGGYFNESNN